MKMGDFMLATMIVFMVCAVVPMVKADLTPKELEDKINNIEKIAKEIKASSISDTNYLEDIKKSVNTPSLSLFGTDYFPTDNGTIFLQLLDDDRQAISSASCYINSWYPNKTSHLSPILMNYLDKGLFYYDIIVPSTLGIYMLSADCYLPSDTWIDDFIDYSKLESYENVSVFNSKASLLDAYFLDTYIWYHLNEDSGTNVPDSSGNNRNGTTQNMEDEDWVVGKLNNSLQFDGVDEYINIDYSVLENITDEVTLEAWIYPTTSSDKKVIVKSDAYTLTLDKVGANLFTSGSIFSSSIEYVATSTTPMSLDNWHHIVMVFKNSYVYVYQDGIQEGQSTQCAFCNIDTNINNITIAGGGTIYFDGKIDEIVIYDSGLNQDDITFRWNNGSGTESMGTENILSGYIRSNPINLNGSKWETFNASYDLKEGNITFQILNSTNDILCNELGDIQSCANNITPIKLYAELSRINTTLTSSEIDRWYVNMITEKIQEIKGAGELNVKNWKTEVNATEIAEAVWSWKGSIANNILSSIWGWSGSIASTILDTISNAVWTRTDRNLTYYEDVTNESLIAGTIWNNSDRTLTSQQELWVGGTEYSPDETTGKIVVRMLNNAGNPVENANCTTYIFYPNNTEYLSVSMTEVVNVTAKGIYYVDFTLGEPTGVYPYGINCVKLGINYFMLDTFHIFGANKTEQAKEVWNYVERNLTYTPPYPEPNNLSAFDVWNYITRNLTYYETANLTLSNESASAIAEAVWTWQGVIGDNILTQIANKIQCYLTRLFTEEDEKWGIDIPIC